VRGEAGSGWGVVRGEVSSGWGGCARRGQLGWGVVRGEASSGWLAVARGEHGRVWAREKESRERAEE
jgi:hypothetical protein